MIANRRRSGSTSRKYSSRLPARSVACIERPVTFPPGRASDATKPVPTGSTAIAKTIGMTDVACIPAGVGLHDARIDGKAFALHQTSVHAGPHHRLEHMAQEVAVAEPCRLTENVE